MTPFATYLLAAMLAWTRVPDCPEPSAQCDAWARVYAEPVDHACARYAEIAEEVAEEMESREDGDAEVARRRYALDLVAIAYEETGFHLLVDDGSCNAAPLPISLSFRVRAIGGCDGGRSASVWQILPDRSIDAVAGRHVAVGDLVSDRPLAIHVAWNLRRVRPSAWTVWPRAVRRSEGWLRGHPFAP